MIMKAVMITLAAIGGFGASSGSAQGIGHTYFMRGSIVGTEAAGPVVCIGKADGAQVGQTLEVYRIVFHPGPPKGVAPSYHRQLVGHVRVDHIFDDHFSHVTVTDGNPARHDIVEFRRK